MACHADVDGVRQRECAECRASTGLGHCVGGNDRKKSIEQCFGDERAVDVDAVIESAAYRAFYMHGTGHWLGLDVHDVGDYLAADEAPIEQPDGLGGRVVKRPSRVLQPGMVVTIEPGLYVRPAEGVPERYWNIGIRIEDDAIVTADGCELISRDVPVDASEIEALMRA